MKYLLLLLLSMSGPLSATTERTKVLGTNVSFEAPFGYTMLSSEEVGRKYAANNAPAQVVGNKRRTTSIAFEFKSSRLLDSELAEAKDVLATSLEAAFPGLRWIERKLIDFQGKRWIYVEMTSRGLDTEIHNIMLMTSLRGRALMFNFNSTEQEFSAVEKELRQSLQSIRIDGLEPATPPPRSDRTADLRQLKIALAKEESEQEHPEYRSSKLTESAREGLRGRYAAEVNRQVRDRWNAKGAPPLVRCKLMFEQIPGGEVIRIEFLECPYEAPARGSIERALRSREIPYFGYEEVFSPEITMTLCIPESECKVGASLR